jgi:hypothetical protein
MKHLKWAAPVLVSLLLATGAHAHPLDHAVECQILKGIEVEDASDVGGSLQINFNDASPILADIAVAIRSQFGSG